MHGHYTHIWIVIGMFMHFKYYTIYTWHSQKVVAFATTFVGDNGRLSYKESMQTIQWWTWTT